jgi:hypothetical protein
MLARVKVRLLALPPTPPATTETVPDRVCPSKGAPMLIAVGLGVGSGVVPCTQATSAVTSRNSESDGGIRRRRGGFTTPLRQAYASSNRAHLEWALVAQDPAALLTVERYPLVN